MKYIKILIFLTQFIAILIGPQTMCVYCFNNNNISKNNNNNQSLINYQLNNNNNNDDDDDKLYSIRSSTSSLTQLNQGLLSSSSSSYHYHQRDHHQQQQQQQHNYQSYNNNNNNNNNEKFTINDSNGSSSKSSSNSNNNNNNNNQQNTNNYYLNTMGRDIRGCQSCKIREQVKSDNLESIKRHILMRLELKQAPKIATEQIIPPEIIEKFYKNHSNYGTSILNNNNNNSGNSNNSNRNNNNNNNNNNSNNNNSDNNNNNNNYGSNMQSDDPNIYQQNYTNIDQYHHQQQPHHHQHNNNNDDDIIVNDDNNNEYHLDNNSYNNDDGMDHYKEEFFSVINSIYVFPTISRMRHNRKPETLHFSLNNNGHSIVSQAILHFYIRGKNWIRNNNESYIFSNLTTTSSTSNNDNNDESILNNNNNNNNTINNYDKDIIITMNRIIRRQNSTHTQKIIESHYQIPNGDGQWYQLDVTDMVKNWYNNPNTNHGIVIKTLEGWMRPLVVIDDLPINKRYALYIEIQTQDNRKKRTKRNSSLNCNENDREERCCRYPLIVNFRDFDWDWIIAPSKFNAFFCNGECKLGFLQRYTHTHLMQLSTAAQPCCSPTKMSSISLLYFNNESNLVMSTIPNMSVDKCSCS